MYHRGTSGPEPLAHLIRWVVRYDGIEACCLCFADSGIVFQAGPSDLSKLYAWAREGRPGVQAILDEFAPEKIKDIRLTESEG